MKNPGFSLPFMIQHRIVWRWLIPMLLVLLFLCTLLWLPWQAQQMEANERQEQLIADTLWVEQTIRFQLGHDEENIRLAASEIAIGHLTEKNFGSRVAALMSNSHELYRLVWLDANGKGVASIDQMPITLKDFSLPSQQASERARLTRNPQYSQPAPPPGLIGPILLDYHVPLYQGGSYAGSLIASYQVSNLLEEMVPWWFAQDNELMLLDSDDDIVARRSAGGAGRGVYTHRHPLDLPGATLTLSTNSIKSAPKLLPNLLVGSVIVLSLGLLWSLWALWRDINRRMAAEGAVRQQVAFRIAMENSLVTGLRARDLEGRLTYVNPAFCEMVGFRLEELLGIAPPMPYWAPEAMPEYQERFAKVLASTITTEGFETIYQRANGERFPVLIFESPLLDDSGKKTGWMGSILDISDRRQAEDLNQQQQEKLQASARLASMGELASTLAHELNQPLAAISSYMAGAINLMESGNANPELLKPALEKAKIQAQRAGHIIRSVHEFVKRREPSRQPVSINTLIDSLIPLVELQAQQFFVTIQTSVDSRLPLILADRVMLEQVLLNLTRNAIEAMQHVPSSRRLLRIVATLEDAATDEAGASPQVAVSVIDQGHGIPPEVATRLFSAFFSTKEEGMGIGLKICRTTIEFHGGTLTYHDNPAGGTIFRFALPVLPLPQET
jgi:two-component system, LuxR family, sensor histidine kinase DctS